MERKITYADIVAIIGIVISLLAFIPPINAPFLNDDYVYVIGNKNFEEPILNIWKYFFTRTNNYEYLPIRDIFYRIQFEISGDSPVGYRIVNYLLYIFCCVMVYINSKILIKFFTEKYSPKNKIPDWIATLTTIFFAIHPAHVESVVWISGLKDLLSGSFLMLAFYFLLKGLLLDNLKKIRLSWLFFLLALLSKSTVLPFIIIAIVICSIYYGFNKDNFKKIYSISFPFVIVGVVFLSAYMLIGSESKILAAPFLFGTWESFTKNYYIPFLILGHLVRIAIFPINLRLIYDISADWNTFITATGLGIFCIIITLIALKKIKNFPLISFGIIWFTIFLTPYLQVIPFHSWSLVSERYLFLSIFGLSLILSNVILLLKKKYIIVAVFFLFFFYNTLNYSFKWQSEAELTKHNAMLNPDNYTSQLIFLENFLMVKDKFPEAYKKIDDLKISELDKERLRRYVRVFELYESGRINEIDENIEWLEGMTDLSSWPGFLNIIGTYYENKGDFIKAIEYYHNAMIYTYINNDRNQYAKKIEKLRHPYMHKIDEMKEIVRNNPNSINAIGTLANLQLEIFLLDEAEINYYKILKLSPDNAIAYYNLGLLYSKRKEEKKAIEFMEKAVEFGFKSPIVYNNLGIAYNKIDRADKAEKMFLEAIEKDKNYWFAYVNLAKLYALKEDFRKAISLFERAKEIVTAQDLNADFIDSYLNVLYKAVNSVKN